MHAGKELPSVGKKACADHCDEIIVHIPYSECLKKNPTKYWDVDRGIIKCLNDLYPKLFFLKPSPILINLGLLNHLRYQNNELPVDTWVAKIATELAVESGMKSNRFKTN